MRGYPFGEGIGVPTSVRQHRHDESPRLIDGDQGCRDLRALAFAHEQADEGFERADRDQRRFLAQQYAQPVGDRYVKAFDGRVWGQSDHGGWGQNPGLPFKAGGDPSGQCQPLSAED
jgi:hypothetical protein